jgi:hypothetical protein
MESVITIQKMVRGYITRKYILIPSSCYQTKKWRKNRGWYKTGKSNECEKYQINLIEKIIHTKLLKTNDRIHIETNTIISKTNPMKYDDGYEWTENFDGKICYKHNIFYFNLKFVCDSGGIQTRSLREVYHFINYQLTFLIKNNTSNIYFINILDGDTSFENNGKFNYLINKEEYNQVNKYVFVGSLAEFQRKFRPMII